MWMMQLTRRTTRDESGSIIVIIGVIMVLTMLTVAVTARTMSGLTSTKKGQDFSGALPQADAGLSDALFRFDQLGVAPASTFCVGNNPACTVSSIPGAPSVQYTARAVDANTYTVLSKGIVNGQPHAIQATVQRGYLYPFAIFAKTLLSFNGNSGNYDPSSCTGPVETVDATGNPVCFPAADVASNGNITCTGATSPAHQQDYFKGGGTSCNNGYLTPGSFNPLNPALNCPTAPNIPSTPCLPASYLPCPANPVTGLLPPVLLGGVYYCNQVDLPNGLFQFPNGFQVAPGGPNNGVVEIYIIPTDSPASNITMSIAGTDPYGGADCTLPTSLPPCGVNAGGDPTKLRVYLAGGSVDPGGGAGAGQGSGDFTGILYAPTAVEVNPSCKANWRGGLVVAEFTCNGGTHLSVKYDTRLTSLTEVHWTVTNYTEIPSGQVTLP
jgi:hypothetical protein